MLAAIAAILLFPNVQPNLIATFSKGERWARVAVGGVSIQGNDLVSGYFCDAVGHHGETSFAKPFVTRGRKLIWLPLGGNEHGQALGSRDGRIYGNVLVDYVEKPAVWTPDPKKGWESAKLAVIKGQNGSAVFADVDGTTWIQEGEPATRLLAASGGVTKTILKEKFELIHVDSKGALYGNRYTAVMFGGRSHDPRAAIYRSGQWELMPKEFALEGVTRQGTMFGYLHAEGNLPAILKAGKVERLEVPAGTRYGYTVAHGPTGLIGGYVAIQSKVTACVWKQGKYADVSSFFPEVERSEVVAIGDSLLIIEVEDSKSIRLYSVDAP
jgi:hypothetical protein